jgi:hypothetical protein
VGHDLFDLLRWTSELNRVERACQIGARDSDGDNSMGSHKEAQKAHIFHLQACDLYLNTSFVLYVPFCG